MLTVLGKESLVTQVNEMFEKVNYYNYGVSVNEK